MSDWQGVHNRAEHVSVGTRASCGICGQWCYAESPCWCCEEVTLGDYTAGDLLARVHVSRLAESYALRDLATARRRLMLWWLWFTVLCSWLGALRDGWAAAWFWAIGLLSTWCGWGEWRAWRSTRAQVTALEAHDD